MWVSHKIPELLVKKSSGNQVPNRFSALRKKNTRTGERVKSPPASQACLSRRPEKKNSEEKVQESESPQPPERSLGVGVAVPPRASCCSHLVFTFQLQDKKADEARSQVPTHSNALEAGAASAAGPPGLGSSGGAISLRRAKRSWGPPFRSPHET
ncbi:unnamed protein product [Rangifer tarandus platyrhynchus]|uniref:Uncharacterized protein n=1 Tax=Rangifer tarandus platyrhynchus TaxID=3082113 RepID=A0ABN9A1Z1_RANTA|nr:unnamed protein product [Rangifer tarandus platyrhynchus]